MKMVVNGKVVQEFGINDLDILEETVPMNLEAVGNGDGTVDVYCCGKKILSGYETNVDPDDVDALWDELYWDKGIVGFAW